MFKWVESRGLRVARFAGHCSDCGRPFQAGDLVKFHRDWETERRFSVHPEPCCTWETDSRGTRYAAGGGCLRDKAEGKDK